MKKIYIFIAFFLIEIFILSGCNNSVEPQQHDLKTSKIAVFLPGKIGDLSWNDSNFEGILLCEEQLNVEIECITDVQESEFEVILTEYGEKGYDLICAAGTQFDEPVNAVAPHFPNTIFCLINGKKCEYDNITLINPKEYEASYLAAIIAGYQKEEITGIIAGYPNDSMEELLDIYEKNTRKTTEKNGIFYQETLRAYTNSWTNRELAKKIALQMINSGANTLFVYTNDAGLGCIDAAKEKGAKIIGFSSDATKEFPDVCIASIKFDFEKIYERILTLYQDGTLTKHNVHNLGVKEDIFEPIYSEHISLETKKEVENAIQQIKNNQITFSKSK